MTRANTNACLIREEICPFEISLKSSSFIMDLSRVTVQNSPFHDAFLFESESKPYIGSLLSAIENSLNQTVDEVY
jgi:hypothetical protein